jgi:hypothetical protein
MFVANCPSVQRGRLVEDGSADQLIDAGGMYGHRKHPAKRNYVQEL